MDGDIEDAGFSEGEVESIFWIRSGGFVVPLDRKEKRNRILVVAAERVEKVHAKAQNPGKLSSGSFRDQKTATGKSENPPRTTQRQELPDNYRTACG